jgi:hypothetical protein
VFKMIVDMASQDTGVAARALAQVIIEAQDAQQDGETGPAAGRQSRRTVGSRTQEDKAPLSAPRPSAPRSTRRRRSQDRAVVLDK